VGPGRPDDAALRDGLVDAFSGEHAGWHTEDLVTEMQITREAQDERAARSERRFSRAEAEGRFEDEIVPVALNGRKGEETLERDETNRPDATAESLARLRPVFREDGTITAGNAPRDCAEAEGLTPEARLVAHGHPIGATGATLTTRLLFSMRRDGLSRGPVTLCIGGGQGIALAFERLRRAPDALS